MSVKREVRRLHAAGLKDAAIARRLGVSTQHVTRTRNRLGLPSTLPRWTAAELAALTAAAAGGTGWRWAAVARRVGRSVQAVKNKWYAMRPHAEATTCAGSDPPTVPAREG